MRRNCHQSMGGKRVTNASQRKLFLLPVWQVQRSCIISLAGELYTSNCAYMPAALFEGRCNFFQLWRNWIISFFGNLAGSLIVVWLVDEVSLRVRPGMGKSTARSKTHMAIPHPIDPVIAPEHCACLCKDHRIADRTAISLTLQIFSRREVLIDGACCSALSFCSFCSWGIRKATCSTNAAIILLPLILLSRRLLPAWWLEQSEQSSLQSTKSTGDGSDVMSGFTLSIMQAEHCTRHPSKQN